MPDLRNRNVTPGRGCDPVTVAEHHAAAIRRNLAIPGGEFAARQIFAEFVHVHGGNPDELLRTLRVNGLRPAGEHEETSHSDDTRETR